MTDPIRRGAILLTSVALASLLAVQAISIYLTERDPSHAVALLPYNGLAWERIAFGQFKENLVTGTAEDPRESAQEAAFSARAFALEAIKRDPLAPRAYAVVVLSSRLPQEREELLALASQLNRHHYALQALVMDQAAANEDYEKVVETLDQMLRVRPHVRERFDSVLLDALATPGAAPAFAKLLDGSSPWHEPFLLSAASATPEANLALARIRSDLTIENTEFDSRLISGLVNQGALTEAKSVYSIATQRDRRATEPPANLSWDFEFPPFDWKLTNRDDLRAQPSRNNQFLEIFARPGQGGVIARRVIDNGSDLSNVSIEVSGERQLKLQLRCEGTREPFHEASLTNGSNRVVVPEIADACLTLNLEVFARSLSDEPTLRAQLGRMKLRYNSYRARPSA